MASVQMNENGLWVPETRVQKNGKESKIEGWWEVRRAGPAEPAPTRGATPLVERVMRVHGFSENFAKRVLRGYRQFMELKSVMNDWQELKLSPPVPINNMWEQHLLDNLNYTEDCLLLFGRVIGHNPDTILEPQALKDRIKTTQIAFQARYGDDLDQEVWDFGDNWNKKSMKGGEDVVPEEAAPSITPRGRLPVASVAGDSRLHAAGSEDDNRPITNVGRGRTVTSPQRSVRSNSKGRSIPMQGKSATSPSNAGVPSGNEPITIFLRDQNTGEETYFSLRYKSTLRIVFTVFAERRGLNQDLLKFSYNGQTLTGYETPHSLALDDRARIDVMIGQRRA
jgi:Ubiquitin-2 like Rad60 SUMO-like